MVCNRCIKVVKDEMEKIGLVVNEIMLGEVSVQSEREINLELIKNILSQNGFELIDDKTSRQIELMKITVIDSINRMIEGEGTNIDFSEAITKATHLSYHYVSTVFSSNEGITLEKYIILQKIEKVKELLVYDELTLSQISDRLDYSSVQHLSNQFKKTTGLTPSYFKKLKNSKRKPLDKII